MVRADYAQRLRAISHHPQVCYLHGRALHPIVLNDMLLRESPIFALCHLYRELSLQQYGPLAGHELVINPINETQVSV